MLVSFEQGKDLVGGLEVTGITGKGFADAHSKAELTGISITFRLPDGTQRTISGATTYNYIMRRQVELLSPACAITRDLRLR